MVIPRKPNFLMLSAQAITSAIRSCIFVECVSDAACHDTFYRQCQQNVLLVSHMCACLESH